MSKAKPPIDKNAEVAHPTQGAVPPMPPAEDRPETALADVAENHPGYFYKPQQGVVSTDVLEVALTLCVQIFAPQIDYPVGALRTQVMSAERFGKLSPEAQRHMREAPRPEPMAPEMPSA